MNKPIRKITQYFPARSLGKQTMELVDGKLILSWKNIFSSYRTNIDLKDINPNYDKGRWEYDDWSNFFWFFLVLSIFSSWVEYLKEYRLILLIISLIFLLLKFVKCDWAYFWDKTQTKSISIRYSGNSKKKEEIKFFIEELEKEINKYKEIK